MRHVGGLAAREPPPLLGRAPMGPLRARRGAREAPALAGAANLPGAMPCRRSSRHECLTRKCGIFCHGQRFRPVRHAMAAHCPLSTVRRIYQGKRRISAAHTVDASFATLYSRSHIFAARGARPPRIAYAAIPTFGDHVTVHCVRQALSRALLEKNFKLFFVPLDLRTCITMHELANAVRSTSLFNSTDSDLRRYTLDKAKPQLKIPFDPSNLTP